MSERGRDLTRGTDGPTPASSPYPVPPEGKPCRGCGRTIYWAHTMTGKAMPLDGPSPDGNVLVVVRDDGTLRVVEQDEPGARRCMPHWATCPNADDFRGTKA